MLIKCFLVFILQGLKGLDGRKNSSAYQRALENYPAYFFLVIESQFEIFRLSFKLMYNEDKDLEIIWLVTVIMVIMKGSERTSGPAF